MPLRQQPSADAPPTVGAALRRAPVPAAGLIDAETGVYGGANRQAAGAIALAHGLSERQVVDPRSQQAHGEGALPGQALEPIQTSRQAGFKALMGPGGVKRSRWLQGAQTVGSDGEINEQLEGPAAAVLLLHLGRERTDQHHLLAGQQAVEAGIVGPAHQLIRPLGACARPCSTAQQDPLSGAGSSKSWLWASTLRLVCAQR